MVWIGLIHRRGEGAAEVIIVGGVGWDGAIAPIDKNPKAVGSLGIGEHVEIGAQSHGRLAGQYNPKRRRKTAVNRGGFIVVALVVAIAHFKVNAGLDMNAIGDGAAGIGRDDDAPTGGIIVQANIIVDGHGTLLNWAFKILQFQIYPRMVEPFGIFLKHIINQQASAQGGGIVAFAIGHGGGPIAGGEEVGVGLRPARVAGGEETYC